MKHIKKLGGFITALALGLIIPLHCSALGVAMFTLPVDFSDDVTATIVGVAGTILVILGVMFAWRKTVKSVNRS